MAHLRIFRAALVLFLAIGWLLAPGSGFALGRKMLPPRFPFTIDPKASIPELLPPPPVLSEPAPPWLVQDLAQVPEVLFQKKQEDNITA